MKGQCSVPLQWLCRKEGETGPWFFSEGEGGTGIFFKMFSVGIRAVLSFKLVRGLKMSSWRYF